MKTPFYVMEDSYSRIVKTPFFKKQYFINMVSLARGKKKKHLILEHKKVLVPYCSGKMYVMDGHIRLFQDLNPSDQENFLRIFQNWNIASL